MTTGKNLGGLNYQTNITHHRVMNLVEKFHKPIHQWNFHSKHCPGSLVVAEPHAAPKNELKTWIKQRFLNLVNNKNKTE